MSKIIKTNNKTSIFKKFNNFYEVGKKKIIDKFNNNSNKSTIIKSNLNNNSNTYSDKTNNSSTNKVSPNKKDRQDDDIFKIEIEEGGVHKYQIQDIDSDEEEESDNNDKSQATKETSDSNNSENNNNNNKLVSEMFENKDAEKNNNNNNSNELIDNTINFNPDNDDLFKQLLIDEFKICHKMLYKGSSIDVSNEFVVPCVRIKEKKSIFNIVGIGSKDIIECDYLLYFDDVYFYPIKNIINLDNINIRKIGNRYKIKSITQIKLKKIDKNFYITLGFIDTKNTNEYLYKTYRFNELNAEKFTSALNYFLQKFNMDVDEDSENNYNYNKEEYYSNELENNNDYENENENEDYDQDVNNYNNYSNKQVGNNNHIEEKNS